MTNPDILRLLDQAVADGETDLETVYGLVAQAFAWMPFGPQVSDSDKVKKGSSADIYNAAQLRALRDDRNKLGRAQKIKNHLAKKSGALLTAAYEEHGSSVLPKRTDKNLDTTSMYWDEVEGNMINQFKDLDNASHLEALATFLAMGMGLDLYVKLKK